MLMEGWDSIHDLRYRNMYTFPLDCLIFVAILATFIVPWVPNIDSVKYTAHTLMNFAIFGALWHFVYYPFKENSTFEFIDSWLSP